MKRLTIDGNQMIQVEGSSIVIGDTILPIKRFIRLYLNRRAMMLFAMALIDESQHANEDACEIVRVD